MKNRNVDVDAMKGLCIILLVYGHAVIDQTSYPEWILCVASFLMPMFMFTSGFYSYSEQRKNDISWIKNRAKLLLVPFGVWQIITMYTKYRFNVSKSKEYLIEVLIQPDKSHWFLIILFELCLLVFIINVFVEKNQIRKV